MTNEIEVQVQGDFIERLVSARPVQALAELVWNSFDGDADTVRIDVKEGALSDSVKAPSNSKKGVLVRITEPLKQWRLDQASVVQELAEIFATYLTDYGDASISLCGTAVDPSASISLRKTYDLEPVEADGQLFSASIEVIEWRQQTERMLYLCNDDGFPLQRISPGIHAPGFDFSAYLRSPYITQLNEQGVLGLGELDPRLTELVDRAKGGMRAHFKARNVERVRNLVQEWKTEESYTSLGYGDLLMTPSWRLLGPLETANGMLMFGVSAAMVFAVMQRLIVAHYADLRS
jgi:hypothetical protein